MNWLFDFVRKHAWRHQWEYGNPYRRTCKICGRHEVSHCHSISSWSYSWWEVFDEGDIELHRK